MKTRKRVRARDVKVGDYLFVTAEPTSANWQVDEIESTRRGKLLFHRHISILYCGRLLSAKGKMPILKCGIQPVQWTEILVEV